MIQCILSMTAEGKNGTQMTLDTGGFTVKTEPPMPSSREVLYKYFRTTRNPEIPIVDTETGEIKQPKVFLTEADPRLPGQPYYLQGIVVVELVGDESRLLDYPFHTVRLVESLPDPTGKRLDEEIVAIPNMIFCILTRDIGPKPA
jgi:hypothetical protein